MKWYFKFAFTAALATCAWVLLNRWDKEEWSLSLSDRSWGTLLIALAHSIPVAIHQGMMMYIVANKLCADCIIQPVPSVPVTVDLNRRVWYGTFLNHVFMMPFIVWVLYPYFIQGYIVALPSSGSIEHWPAEMSTIFWQLGVCIVVEDALFYWSHRLLHQPWFYSKIHKKHHEFKSLTGYSIASEFTHPVESLVGNVLPVMAGPLLVKCNFNVLLAWIVLRMFKTCDAHCGYNFKWSPFGICWPLNPARCHDLHHESGFGVCFGSFFVFWDTICGTGETGKQAKKVIVQETIRAATTMPKHKATPAPAVALAVTSALPESVALSAPIPAKKSKSYAEALAGPPPKRARSTSRKRKN
jgi:sterol desaturase/sphingolipid hydroxylase (fatty acid hydroxylase superfamily)